MVSLTKVNALLSCITGGLLLANLLLFKASCSIYLFVGLGVWLATLTIGNFWLINKEQKDKLQLELSVQNLDSRIGDSTYSLNNQAKEIEKILDSLQKELIEEHKLNLQNVEPLDNEQFFFSATPYAKNLSLIHEKLNRIERAISQVTKYRNQTSLYGELICDKRKTKQQMTNVNELVAQVVERVRLEKLEKSDDQITVEEAYDPNLRRSKIDRSSLGVILDNLIDNAFEAVNSQLDREPSYRPTVKIETKKRNKWIDIIVQDNGMGMSQLTKSQIFDPFFSSHSETAQGLGLTLVREMVALQQGQISHVDLSRG